MLPAMRGAEPHHAGNSEAGRIIVVADKGLNTSNNFAVVVLDCNGFILSQSVCKAIRELKAGCSTTRSTSRAPRVHSRSRAAPRTKAVWVAGEAASHNWVLEEAEIAADEACGGCCCIITSEQEMDDREVIEAYRGLWRIEDSFRMLKSNLGARQAYVSREEHARAHFLVCYVALLVMRLMQLDAEGTHTAAQIVEDLRGVVDHGLDASVYLIDYRTDLTDELASAAGIDLPRQVLTKDQIGQIMPDMRKPLVD